MNLCCSLWLLSCPHLKPFWNTNMMSLPFLKPTNVTQCPFEKIRSIYTRNSWLTSPHSHPTLWPQLNSCHLVSMTCLLNVYLCIFSFLLLKEVIAFFIQLTACQPPKLSWSITPSPGILSLFRDSWYLYMSAALHTVFLLANPQNFPISLSETIPEKCLNDTLFKLFVNFHYIPETQEMTNKCLLSSECTTLHKLYNFIEVFKNPYKENYYFIFLYREDELLSNRFIDLTVKILMASCNLKLF